MTVIRHWIATNPPLEGRTTGWEPKVLDSEQSAETYLRLGWRVIEYVPAEQLAGAVSALREVERLCAVAGGEHSSSPTVVQITQAARGALASPRTDHTNGETA